MNPYIVIDAKKVVPDHFGLVLAASARGHALKAGAQPLVDDAECSPAELAMKEIASRAISEDDLTNFLSATKPRQLSLMRPTRD
tara:strand:- start:10879 stop:11130 length:252 start_codon:yes stop_codon:yes gene_type:complete